MKILKISFFVISIILSIKAQSFAGTVSGFIKDENEKAIPFANLSLQELSISTMSDNKGFYTFNSIPEGNYHLYVAHSGYQNKTLIVNVGTSETELNIILEKSLIETPTIDVSGSFKPNDISNSPYSVTSIG